MRSETSATFTPFSQCGQTQRLYSWRVRTTQNMCVCANVHHMICIGI